MTTNLLKPLVVRLGWLLAAWTLLPAGLASAQDALRYSLAGDAVAEAQRRQMLTPQPYTFKSGDFRLLAVPSLEMDYNDNVALVKKGAQSDFILKPLVQLKGSYPLTQQNLLFFDIGLGYNEYLEHGQYSALQVNSDSQLMLDMRIKDFLFNFHERVSFIEDPGAEASVAGTGQYGTFMNFAGLTTTWDLEAVSLTLSYDHLNMLASSGQFSYLNHSSELPLVRAGFKFTPQLSAGVEGTASFTHYDQSTLNDNQSYSAGLYADWKPDSFLDVQPRAGYSVYQFQHTSQSAQIFELTPAGVPLIVPKAETIQTSDLNTWYASLQVTHNVSEAVSYSLSAGHEIRAGIQSDVVEDSYFRPSIKWAIIKNLDLNTSLFYEHGSQGEGNVTGNLTETYDHYGGGLMVSYPVTKKLRLSLNYRLTLRSSNLPDRDYEQNIVGIRLAYQPQ